MVIIIYPLSGDGLDLIPAEVQDLTNVLPGAQLAGVYDSEKPIMDVVDRMARSDDEARGMWIAGHADSDSVIMGNITLSVAALVTYVRMARVQWVVFNTCYGDNLARRLRSETGVATLAVNTQDNEITDNDAWRMAAAMARSLAANDMNLGDAYKELYPRGHDNYLFRESLNGNLQRAIGGDDDDILAMIYQIRLKVALLEQNIEIKLSDVADDILSLKKMMHNADSVSWGMLLLIVSIAVVYFVVLVWLVIFTRGTL